MGSLLVIKFGGSVLQNDDTITKSVKIVLDATQQGFEVVVVVSALKGVTDSLMSLSKKINPNASPEYIDEILAMGERTSARLFANALFGVGLRPMVIDPDSDSWPIVTDDNHLDANPLYSETKAKVKERLQPLVESGVIPVVCGFIGKTTSGRITTLGRGGSDTTAVLLGSCLEAKEVILVKDVNTVFSTDPDRVGDAVPVLRLDSEEAFALSYGGAKFLHPKALHYKEDEVKVRITSLENGASAGTVIDGGSTDLKIDSSPEPITMVTIVGESVSEGQPLASLISEVRNSGGRIVSLSLEVKSIILYIHGGKNLLKNLHGFMMANGFGKAISIYENLSMLTVKSRAMETNPGMIQRVTQPLARKGINVYGLVTISSSIRVFISRDDTDKAARLLGTALMVDEDVRQAD